GWFYGDAIFIIEPWLMIVLVGMAGGAHRSRWLRAALLLALVALIALAWSVAVGGPGLALVLAAFGAPWLWWLWRADFGQRWRRGGAALALGALVLLGTRHVARASVRESLSATAPELELVDLVATPAPGDPLCWWFLAVQRSPGRSLDDPAVQGRYVVREAIASGWPWLSSATRCRVPSDGRTAPLRPTSLAAAPGREVVWGPEFEAPL